MTNIIVDIGKGVEVTAKDFLGFLDKVKEEGELALSPRAMLALSVLGVAVGQAVIASVSAASVDGLNITLDLEAASLIIKTWPSLEAYLKTLAIRPATPKG
jgi:hypothetical protein